MTNYILSCLFHLLVFQTIDGQRIHLASWEQIFTVATISQVVQEEFMVKAKFDAIPEGEEEFGI
jgi:hypothetical protein